MRPRSSALLVAALVLVVAVPAFAPATAQVDRNEQVCPVCGPEFERATVDAGAGVTVEGSTAVVEVERDGTAH